LKKGITDTIKAELLDLIRDAVPKEGKKFDYEKLAQVVRNILDERKETESVAALADPRIQADEKPTRSGNRVTKGLLIASLLLNILLLALGLYKMIFESSIPFF
jgi:hypothetical protein